MTTSAVRHWLSSGHVTVILAYTLTSMISGAVLETGVHDYCSWEYFNATCPPGSLVVINSAHYGRMKVSRCMDSDYDIGCQSDVLPQLDTRCSGRPSCSFLLPDQTLHHIQPCKKDLLAYLEASYSCIPVTGADDNLCLESGPIRLTQAEGYLASYMAQLHGHGTSVCPWMIHGSPGQHVKLAVLDFSTGSRYSRADPEVGGQGRVAASAPADYCHIFATVSEEKHRERVNVCAEKARESIIYTSKSHAVSIELSDTVVNDQSVSFIIKFMVFGCADPPPPSNSWTRRSGDKITITCNDTTKSWHLVCKDTRWIGKTDECRGVPFGDKVVDDPTFPSYGLAIAVIIGIFVGAMCGFLLLAVVLWCRRQSVINSPRYSHHNIELMMTGPTPEHPEHMCKVHRIPTGDYGYTHVWELRNTQLPMSPGPPMCPASDIPDSFKSTCHTSDPRLPDALLGRLEHSYDCSNFDERLLQVTRVHGHHLCPNVQPLLPFCTTMPDPVSPGSTEDRMRPSGVREPSGSAEGRGSTEDEEDEASERTLNYAKDAAAGPVTITGSFIVHDQDPILVKVPLKIENHYL